jgi:hypothetical protein
MATTSAPAQAPVAPAKTPTPAPTLNANDRCDEKACGAQAYVLVKLSAGSLLFCGHHYTARKLELDVAAVDVIDETGFILPPKQPVTGSAFS